MTGSMISSEEAAMDSSSSSKRFFIQKSGSKGRKEEVAFAPLQQQQQQEEEEERRSEHGMRAAKYRSQYLRSYKLSRKETVRERVKRSLSRLKSLACTFLACQYHLSAPYTTSSTIPSLKARRIHQYELWGVFPRR